MAQKQKEKQKASTSGASAVTAKESIIPVEEEDGNSYTVVDKLEVKLMTFSISTLN